MSRTIRCLLAFLLFAASTAHAADLLPGAKKKLDAYFDGLQQQGLVSGSIAISERGAMRYQRSIGFASIENGVPQTSDAGTRYRIGPVSRVFVATLMMQLAESATITLDNKVAEFFPDAPNALTTSYRDLLSAPDDASYLLLVRVLRKVEEHPLDESLRLRVARKLGLARTYLAGFGAASTLESVSYEWRDGWQAVPNGDPSPDDAVADVISNAGDLVTFIDAMYSSRIVTSYSLGTMTEQGIGLRKLELAGKSCVGDRGRVAAFDTFVCHFADSRISIAWTGNASRVPADQMLDEIGRIVFRKAR